VKGIVVLTMCRVSEFRRILDSGYAGMGLSVYVGFGLGK